MLNDLPRYVSIDALKKRGWLRADIVRLLTTPPDALLVTGSRPTALYAVERIRGHELRDATLRARLAEQARAEPVVRSVTSAANLFSAKTARPFA